MTVDDDTRLYEQLVEALHRARGRGGGTVRSFTQAVAYSSYGALGWEGAAVDSLCLNGLLGACALARLEPEVLADNSLSTAIDAMVENAVGSQLELEQISQEVIRHLTRFAQDMAKMVELLQEDAPDEFIGGMAEQTLQEMHEVTQASVNRYQAVCNADQKLLDCLRQVHELDQKGRGSHSALPEASATVAIDAHAAAQKLQKLMEDDCKLFVKVAKACDLQNSGGQLVQALSRATTAAFARHLSPAGAVGAKETDDIDATRTAAEVAIPALCAIKSLLDGPGAQCDPSRPLAYAETIIGHALAVTDWPDTRGGGLQAYLQKTLDPIRAARGAGQVPGASSQEAATLLDNAEMSMAAAMLAVARGSFGPGADLEVLPIVTGDQLVPAANALEVHIAIEIAHMHGIILEEAAAKAKDRAALQKERQAQASSEALYQLGSAESAVLRGKSYSDFPATLQALNLVMSRHNQRNMQVLATLRLAAALLNDALCRSAATLSESSSSDKEVKLGNVTLSDYRRQQLFIGTTTIHAFLSILLGYTRGLIESQHRSGRESIDILRKAMHDIAIAARCDEDRHDAGTRARRVVLQLINHCGLSGSQVPELSERSERDMTRLAEEMLERFKELARLFDNRELDSAISEAIEQSAKRAAV